MEEGRFAPEVDAEAALLARLRRGESAAFEELVRENVGPLRAVARRILRNESDADDAVQEGFLSAFRSLHGFRGGSRLGTWLHRIVTNCALMKLRAKGTRDEGSIEELLPRFFDNGAFVGDPRDWSAAPDAALDRETTRRVVRDCIEALPDRYRVVLLLRDIQQLDNQELAEQLGVSPNAAKVRVHRARQALRGLLEDRWDELIA